MGIYVHSVRSMSWTVYIRIQYLVGGVSVLLQSRYRARGRNCQTGDKNEEARDRDLTQRCLQHMSVYIPRLVRSSSAPEP